MKLHRTGLIAPLVALSLATAAPAQEAAEQKSVDPATVLATVDGVEITAAQLMLMRRQLPQQYQSLPDDVLFDALVDQAINQQLFAKTLSHTPSSILNQLVIAERELRAAHVIERLAREAVTEDAVAALYEEKFADATPGREYNAAHILVGTEEEALEVIAELDAGAEFGAVARIRSTGPSGPNGGELGWFGPGMMVEAFETAVTALEPGQVSDPVQTQFGWHVIKLNETRFSEAPPLSEIEGELIGEVQERAIESALNELLDNGTIDRGSAEEFDPSFLSNPEFLAE